MDKEQKKGTASDKIKILLSVVLLAASIVIFYFHKANDWRGMAFLLGGVALSIIFWFFSSYGKRFIGFFRDSWREMAKVVWPTRKETLQMTFVVFMFVVFLVIILWGADSAISYVLYDLVLGWR